MSIDKIKSLIEALIFVSDRPVGLTTLEEILGSDGVNKEEIQRSIQELIAEYQSLSRAFVLEEVGGGFQFRTRPEHAPWIKKLIQSRPLRLTKAALDVLAIVAYKQPVTRPEIEHIRGVDSGGVLEHLLEKKLITIAGRKHSPGRPIIYKTTPEFLEVFNLKDIKDLPTLREYRDISELKDLEPATRDLIERMKETSPPAQPAASGMEPTMPQSPSVPAQEPPASIPEETPDIKKHTP